MTASPERQGSLRRLSKRAQFLHAAKGRRAGRSAFSLQVIAVSAETAGIGLTVTKKTGNAPQRNRIKRRLRAAVQACAPKFLPQHDYVLVGRREALNQPFGKLVGDLSAAITAVNKIHANSAKTPRDPK